MPIENGSDRTIFRDTSPRLIQGVPQVSANTYRGGRGDQDEQKIIWEGVVMGKLLFLGLAEEKKFLVN